MPVVRWRSFGHAQSGPPSRSRETETVAQLTDRQREIKKRLNKGMGAREIAADLGITRNAVYQQIQRMRRYGELDPGFTPTGQPPRQKAPGTDVLMRLVNGDPNVDDADAAALVSSLALISELKYTRDQLSALVAHLNSFLPT